MTPLAVAVLAGCGDPVLPSDYAGTPAAAINGDVAGLTSIVRDAERPRMSLEWLVGDDTNGALTGQLLTFRRSSKLQHDWDIGLGWPREGAKFDLPVEAGAGAGARIGVGKIVYFDDRNNIDRVDWSCKGAGCNRVLAVSDQFVLYVDRPAYCQAVGKTMPEQRIGTGFHYLAFDAATKVMREIGPAAPLSFTTIDTAPADSMPAADLQRFRDQLERSWWSGPLGGCD
jgi:hypothetical protein